MLNYASCQTELLAEALLNPSCCFSSILIEFAAGSPTEFLSSEGKYRYIYIYIKEKKREGGIKRDTAVSLKTKLEKSWKIERDESVAGNGMTSQQIVLKEDPSVSLKNW